MPASLEQTGPERWEPGFPAVAACSKPAVDGYPGGASARPVPCPTYYLHGPDGLAHQATTLMPSGPIRLVWSHRTALSGPVTGPP